MRLLLAAVLSLLLAGCGGSAADRAGVQAAKDGLSPDEAAEKIYGAFLEDKGLVPRFGDAKTMLALGHQICETYDEGHSFVEVVNTLVDNGMPAYEAGQINGAATAAFCPNHATP